MKKYLMDYINYLENNLDKEKPSEVIVHIGWFSHERLIHLIVTLFYALMFLIFMCLGVISWVFLIPALILMVFLCFYIIHYFRLENGVQYLYKLYDKMMDSKKSRHK